MMLQTQNAILFCVLCGWAMLLKAYTNNTNDLYEVFGNYTALY